MKVCFFIATLNNSGGTERALTAVASKLIHYGYDISIICWSGGTNSFFPLNENIKRYALYNESGINIYKKYLPSFIKYKKLIKKLKPEVIVDVCVPLSLISIPATRFTGIKVVSWEQFNVKVSWNFFTAKASRWLASKFSKKIVVLTNTDKDEYQKRFHSSNQFVIPNPVSMAVPVTSSLTSKNVLAVGRLTYQKGFDLLLKAWHTLVNDPKYADHGGWKLSIAGGGEDETALKQLCSNLQLNDSVTFTGPTKNIEALYLDATIFVMSSRFEGLPLALVEAKAFGLPTVSFDCETGPREVIAHGEDGLLVEANNATALATALLRLIENPEERKIYSFNSINKAKKYALAEIVKSWNELLTKL